MSNIKIQSSKILNFKKRKYIIFILILFFPIGFFLWKPETILGTGGVYTLTKHGNSSTGVLRLSSEPKAECSQCHIEHASRDGQQTGGPYYYTLFTDNNNNLCFTASGAGPCHNGNAANKIFQGATNYNTSTHAITSNVKWPGPTPPARVESDAAGKCLNCHTPHGYKAAHPNSSNPTLQELVPSQTFAWEEILCETCHDNNGPASDDIKTDITKTYNHPANTSSYAKKHLESEGGDPTKFAYSPTNNRHSECVDCHNVHVLQTDIHTPTAPTLPKNLTGISRIKVTNGGAGTTPTYTYIPYDDSTTTPIAEYQICFKCHSSWTTQPPGQTDMAVKFNSNNPSYHPIEAQGKNTNINVNAFVGGWLPTQQMYCSDCHGADNTTRRGPHGSTYNYILKKSYTASTTKRTMSSTELCFDCHRYDTYANQSASSTIQGYSRFNPPSWNRGHTFHVQSKQYTCYNCHDSHASTTKPHLIVTGRSPGLTNYTETSSGGTCYPTCHGSKTYTINYAR